MVIRLAGRYYSPGLHLASLDMQAGLDGQVTEC